MIKSKGAFASHKFNIVKQRGSPTEVELRSGHIVRKESYIYYHDESDQWRTVKASDYHGEHFIYVDPLFNEGVLGHFSFMCTCGSPAVIVGPEDAKLEDTGFPERLLVCYIYHLTLTNYGHGWHQTSDGRRWV